jgi:hypothetical protein
MASVVDDSNNADEQNISVPCIQSFVSLRTFIRILLFVGFDFSFSPPGPINVLKYQLAS